MAAQTTGVIVGGCVYGGGNAGNLRGSTNVEVNSGVLLGDTDFNNHLPGAVKAGDAIPGVVGVKFTHEEIMAASPGDPAYGKSPDDWKINPNYTEKSAAVYNAHLYLGRGGGVFGGARMADVNGTSTVTINGGHVLNVYGANDVSGSVKGGTNVNIYSSVVGDVYGGGNGSYIYCDIALTDVTKEALRAQLKDPSKGYNDEQVDYLIKLQNDVLFSAGDGEDVLDALYDKRPSTPSANILLQGSETKQVYVNGGVYCGGNSATLHSNTQAVTPKAVLTLGTYVAPRNIFMGCNGENLVANSTLLNLANRDFSSIDLRTAANMAKYMKSVEMSSPTELRFTNEYPTDLDLAANPIQKYAHIGNFFCGGNVGSITTPGTLEFHFSKATYIHEKLVGGCNNALVPASLYNAEYLGGMIVEPTSSTTKIRLNLAGTYLEPRKLMFDVDDLRFAYDWYYSNGDDDPETDDDRLKWGNIYGGCFTSGQIKGDVEINITKPVYKSETIFKTTANENSGVPEFVQCQDVFCKALSVFGGGYGRQSVIQGSTTINIEDDADILQVFGGGEQGPVNGNCTVNLRGGKVHELYGGGFAGYVNGHTTVDLEGGWFYDAFGGACDADIRDYTEVFIGRSGFTTGVNVYGGNDFGGMVGLTSDPYYNANTSLRGYDGYDFGANDDMLYPDTYVEYIHGAIDSIAGGNYGNYDYEGKYTYIASQLHDLDPVNYPSDFHFAKPSINKSFVNIITPTTNNTDKVKYFLGGSEGASGEATNDKMQHDTYVLVNAPGLNMPGTNVYGGGAHAGLCGGTTKVYLVQGKLHNAFGASLNEGGTEHAHVYVPDGSTIHVNAIFGGADGSLVQEPEESDADFAERKADFDLNINKIPCDAKYAVVDYNSSTASVEEAIYGGNNFQRRTVFSTLNINVPVHNQAGELIDIYGAGLGDNSWGCCTHINLNDGAQVKNVYGGGSNGRVFESLSEWERLMVEYRRNPDRYDNGPEPGAFFDDIPIIHQWIDDPKQQAKFTNQANYKHEDADGQLHYLDNLPHVETQADGVRVNNPRFEEFCALMGLDPVATREKYNERWAWTPGDHNTNVFINEGALVTGNAFAGGKGSSASVSGRSCITLNGGEVQGNIYGGGEEGYIADRYMLGMDKVNVHNNGDTAWEYDDPYIDPADGLLKTKTSYLTDETINDTIASARVFINGGKVRYVYGGGLAGHVGCRVVDWDDRTLQSYPGPSNYGIIYAPTYVTVGFRDKYVDPSTLTHAHGLPTITRSVFGGGERGRVVGIANLTINSGYIGYRYEGGQFVENIVGEDGTILNENGNAFGAGYGEGALVYHTRVLMHGGTIRNSLYGGGEIAAVGHGIMSSEASGSVRPLESIKFAGDTRIEMFNGHVKRDVFGGGRGYSYDRTGNEIVGSQLYTDGYVFGETTVHIHGGEVGTEENVTEGYGNVFGGGNIGYVYSGFGTMDRSKDTGSPGNYYYYSNQVTYICTTAYHSSGEVDYRVGDTLSEWDYSLLPSSEQSNWTRYDIGELTEDCTVVVEPYTQVKPKWNDISNNNTEMPVYSVTVNNKTYDRYDYVPIDDLNMLKSKDDVSAVGALTPGDSGYGDALAGTDKATWAKLDDKGILIHNAVFAGGNVAIGSDKIYANATTVYGNVTASVRDVFSRDLITIGTEHIGGLYGGGNLSRVNGYRELHIENYGTDYYNLASEVTLDYYRTQLSDREKAYFRLRFKALNDIEGVTVNGVSFPPIPKDKTIFEDEYKELPPAQQNTPGQEDKWEIDGVCNLHAGRLLNTIQRADLVGMYGSRLVLQGAVDRVTDVVDYTRYTINRVGELSLNKQNAPYAAPNDATNTHGNYFGIYNVVNYLGNLTSDVKFEDTHTFSSGVEYSYYNYKYANKDKRKRNDGSCHNKVALASGVFLELTTEHSTAEVKDYGYITGIIELDLIRATVDAVGGGYVYAKNEHRARTYFPNRNNVTLSPYNQTCRTYKRYIYDPNSPELNTLTSEEREGAEYPTIGGWGDYLEIETSGNFIHDANKKVIVDDCYPNNFEYIPGSSRYSPAHYWYVKGSIYIYDQYVSAYTGTATAYEKEVKIPLTITAGSHGKMRLLNVQPNLYAYNKSGGGLIGESGQPVNNGAQTYYLNDVIDYWSYSQLNDAEKTYFTKETMRSVAPYKLDPNGAVQTDTVKTLAAYETFKESLQTQGTVEHALYSVEKDMWVPADEIFHSSNNMGHNTGYVLTLDMDSPRDWNRWYTPNQGSDTSISTAAWGALPKGPDAGDSQDDYTAGPTYSPNVSTAYGQRRYEMGELVPKEVYDNYIAITTQLTGQATVTMAYAAKEPITYSGGTITVGSPVSESRYKALTGFNSATGDYSDSPVDHTLFEQAQMCTETIELADGEFLFNGEVVTSTQIAEMKAKYITTYKDKKVENYMTIHGTSDVTAAKTALGYDSGALNTEAQNDADELFASSLSLAYYCETAGLYGGQQYDDTKNYGALASWCSLSAEDRAHFTFNYDALDLLIDPYYGGEPGKKYQYDSKDATLDAAEAHKAGYSLERPVEYTATYTGTTPIKITSSITVTRNGLPTSTDSIQVNDILNRVDYEKYIHNEQYHFAPITVNKSDKKEDYYIVNTAFVKGDIPYTAGQLITPAVYITLTDTEREKVTKQAIDYSQLNDDPNLDYVILFYNTENFTRVTGGTPVDGLNIATGEASGTYAAEAFVPKETFLTKTEYAKLANDQKHFLIKGEEPTERTTLYVSRESEIEDVGKERIYTVIYQYTYNESDDSDNVELANELHIINIHVKFESGVPTIGQLLPPATVLPGSTVGLKQPSVTKGAYEIMGGGWEIFTDHDEALSHHNGEAFQNNGTRVYWYQNQYENAGNYYGCWVAYYAMTRAGKTYSNPVPLSVANYHDLAAILADKQHHLYVDHPNVQRDSKVYINDYSANSQNGLDLLKDLYDLSLLHSTGSDDGHLVTLDANGLITGGDFDGHALLNNHVRAGENLDIFLRTDLSASSGSPNWTSLGSSSETCFSGVLHGDGHTISGLDHSLFNHLCGDVYNLGVTGSFTGAGIAETGSGYVENCWVKTSATSGFPAGTKAVFGNPTRGDGTQLVNCYYPESNAESAANAGDGYSETSHPRGNATKMTDREFYNGAVTYNLNGFYLKERFDRNRTVGGGSAAAIGDTYVTSRFADGDFIYANGVIPTKNDIRRTETTDPQTSITSITYPPRWPDDYVFFGQMLTFGYNTAQPHQSQPTCINKVEMDNGIYAPYMYLPETENSDRVYRCPAYFRSKQMGVFYYNPWANYVGHSADGKQDVYAGMTAADLTGYNDVYKDESGTAVSLPYRTDWQTTNSATNTPYAGRGLERGVFFPPILDDGGMIGVLNRDLTYNFLHYAPVRGDDPTAATYKTYTTMHTTAQDPNFADYFSVDADDPYGDYKTVKEVTGDAVHVHIVDRDSPTAATFTAIRDHMLVDNHDFNCPIEYKFATGKRMWHQRRPALFAGQKKDSHGYVTFDNGTGWESISLPFTADLVTTQKKGELTHFYNVSGGSATEVAKGNTGHEYWLRTYSGMTSVAASAPEPAKSVANFTYPAALSTDAEKIVTNDFLWEYYYSQVSQQDEHADIYRTYYATQREYAHYPRLTKATPYLIGFPGERYYEFDLSGQFVPEHTASPISTLAPQVITFASETGITINVSDDEIAAARAAADKNGYIFVPTYMNDNIAAGADTYTAKADGSGYDKVPATGAATPVKTFRPYFEKSTSSSSVKGTTRSIVFSNEYSSLYGEEEESDNATTGSLDIRARGRRIVVTSTLDEETTVHIFTSAGQLLDTYTIVPGQTVETRVHNTGIYLVNRKKLSIK